MTAKGALSWNESTAEPGSPRAAQGPLHQGQALPQQNSRRNVLVGEAQGHPHVPQSRVPQPSGREKPKALGIYRQPSSQPDLRFPEGSCVSAGACIPSLRGSSTRKPEQRGWVTKQVGQCTPRAAMYRLCCSLLRRESKPIVPLQQEKQGCAACTHRLGRQ